MRLSPLSSTGSAVTQVPLMLTEWILLAERAIEVNNTGAGVPCSECTLPSSSSYSPCGFARGNLVLGLERCFPESVPALSIFCMYCVELQW